MSHAALMIALLSATAPAAAQDRTSDAWAPYTFVITDPDTGEIIDYDRLGEKDKEHYAAMMTRTVDQLKLVGDDTVSEGTIYCEGGVGTDWTWLSCSLFDYFACNVSVSIEHKQVGGCCGILHDSNDSCWGQH